MSAGVASARGRHSLLMVRTLGSSRDLHRASEGSCPSPRRSVRRRSELGNRFAHLIVITVSIRINRGTASPGAAVSFCRHMPDARVSSVGDLVVIRIFKGPAVSWRWVYSFAWRPNLQSAKTAGFLSTQGRASYSSYASDNSVASPPMRALSWLPIGKPFESQCSGTEAAGVPQMLCKAVYAT